MQDVILEKFSPANLLASSVLKKLKLTQQSHTTEENKMTLVKAEINTQKAQPKSTLNCKNC